MKINIRDIIGYDTPVIITQEQGVKWIKNPLELHNGIDLKLPKFHPLTFPMDGIVTRASYHFSDPIHAFGNRVSEYVVIDGKKVELYFCHLDGFNPAITLCDNNGGFPKVKKGDFIGRVGCSGSTYESVPVNGGIHLHISVRNYDDGDWLFVRNFIDFGDNLPVGHEIVENA